MTQNTEMISHPGIIEAIGEEKIQVRILSKSACASCHAKGACTMADMEEKIIDVTNTPHLKVTRGQEVQVAMKKNLGPKAVWVGYVYPFLLVLVGLIVFSRILPSEGTVGLVSLSLLVPYYGLLYLMRNKLQKTFVFEIIPGKIMCHPSD